MGLTRPLTRGGLTRPLVRSVLGGIGGGGAVPFEISAPDGAFSGEPVLGSGGVGPFNFYVNGVIAEGFSSFPTTFPESDPGDSVTAVDSRGRVSNALITIDPASLFFRPSADLMFTPSSDLIFN